MNNKSNNRVVNTPVKAKHERLVMDIKHTILSRHRELDSIMFQCSRIVRLTKEVEVWQLLLTALKPSEISTVLIRLISPKGEEKLHEFDYVMEHFIHNSYFQLTFNCSRYESEKDTML